MRHKKATDFCLRLFCCVSKAGSSRSCRRHELFGHAVPCPRRGQNSLGRATKTAQTFVCAVFVVCQKQARIGCTEGASCSGTQCLAPQAQNSLRECVQPGLTPCLFDFLLHTPLHGGDKRGLRLRRKTRFASTNSQDFRLAGLTPCFVSTSKKTARKGGFCWWTAPKQIRTLHSDFQKTGSVLSLICLKSYDLLINA